MPPSACQRNAIQMAFRLWVTGGLILFAGWPMCPVSNYFWAANNIGADQNILIITHDEAHMILLYACLKRKFGLIVLAYHIGQVVRGIWLAFRNAAA